MQAGRDASSDDDWQSLELVWANAAQGAYREWAVLMVRDAARREHEEVEQSQTRRGRDVWGPRAGTI